MDSSIVFDCIVIGVGGHGSAIAANLAQSGLKVLGLEQFTPVHAKGSSHGRTRVYRQAYFEDPKYVPLLVRSLELWKELNSFYRKEVRERCDSSSPSDLITMCGGMIIGAPDSPVVAGTLRSIQEHSMPHLVLSSDDMKEQYPLYNLNNHEIGVFEKNGGVLMAEACIGAYIAMAQKYGADLHFEEPMLDWSAISPDHGVDSMAVELGLSSGIRVRTEKGTYYGKKLVLSVGAWAPTLFGDNIQSQLKLIVERRVLMWFRTSEESVEEFKKIPIYLWDTGDSSEGMFYGFPSEENHPGEVKIAFHLVGKTTDCGNHTLSPDTLDREVHANEIEEMRKAIRARIPAMNNALLQTATCMYTTTQDGHFVIDFHPENKDVLLVSPCSGHGFKFLPIVGEIVGDLVRVGRTDYDISLFNISRFNSK